MEQCRCQKILHPHKKYYRWRTISTISQHNIPRMMTRAVIPPSGVVHVWQGRIEATFFNNLGIFYWKAVEKLLSTRFHSSSWSQDPFPLFKDLFWLFANVIFPCTPILLILKYVVKDGTFLFCSQNGLTPRTSTGNQFPDFRILL